MIPSGVVDYVSTPQRPKSSLVNWHGEWDTYIGVQLPSRLHAKLTILKVKIKVEIF